MQLSDEEREHIRLTEEYRAEVRANLEKPPSKGESMFDKLAVPLLIVIVSGLLAPWILGRVEENRRALDLQSRLIEQIVGDDAAAQVSLAIYRDRIAGYRLGLVEIELKRRLLSLATVDSVDRETQRTDLHDELVRQRTLRDDGYLTMMAGRSKFLIEQRGNTEWVRLHYGAIAVLDSYVQASRRDHDEAQRRLTLYALSLDDIYEKSALRFRTCSTERVCRDIFKDAENRIYGLYATQLEFTTWDAARQELIRFISETKPRV